MGILRQELKSDNLQNRYAAAGQFSQMPQPKSKFAVDLLRGALMDKDPRMRDGALAALSNFGPLKAQFISELSMVLKDPDPNFRSRAAYELSNFGPAAKSAIPALVTAMNDQELSVRQAAAFELAKVDPTDGRSVPILLGILSSGDRSQQAVMVIFALGAMGAAAQGAVPILERLILANLNADDADYGSEAYESALPAQRHQVKSAPPNLRSPSSGSDRLPYFAHTSLGFGSHG
jgi:HEAT repeat protein